MLWYTRSQPLCPLIVLNNYKKSKQKFLVFSSRNIAPFDNLLAWAFVHCKISTQVPESKAVYGYSELRRLYI